VNWFTVKQFGVIYVAICYGFHGVIHPYDGSSWEGGMLESSDVRSDGMLSVKKMWLTTLSGWALAFYASTAWSLGFGQPASRAVLGEVLSVTIPVRLNPGEELDDECVAADVFFGEDKQAGSAVKLSMSAANGGQRLVRIRTNSRVQEPVFTVYLVVGCTTKITRKFVGFADPPGMDIEPAQVMGADVPPEKHTGQTGGAVSSAAQAEPVSQAAVKSNHLATLPPSRASLSARAQKASRVSRAALSEVTPATSARPSTSLLASADAVSNAARQRSPRATTQTKGARKWTGSARLDGNPAQADGSRLELDPAATDALVEPDLNMTGGMALPAGSMDAPELQERRAAAAALWAAMNASPEQLARDRQRMQELESRLARLQQDAAAASKKLQDMEVRVREAEDGRLNHPLVYALAGVCALLAGALGWIFLRQRGQQGASADWWQGDATPEGAPTIPGLTEPSMAHERDEASVHALEHNTNLGALLTANEGLTETDAPLGGGGPLLHDAQASQMTQRTQTGHAAWTFGNETPPAAGGKNALREDMGSTQAIHLKQKEPVREMSVEELIDLEQQAEFFVVLGQDHAATELLESHVQSGAGASPLPFLKLLEIYQRLEKRDDYERVQQAFNERFNAYAPSWESDLQQGHALQDYPGVVERLQALWSQPRRAMEVLQHSLTRPDDTVETFDLPAYRELLMLYSVARDLFERQSDEQLQVDIDVPDLSFDELGAADTVVAPLTATRPIRAEPRGLPALSVDFSLDEPAPLAEAAKAHVAHPQDLGPIDFVVVPDDGAVKPKRD
jgi:hypothetical protein